MQVNLYEQDYTGVAALAMDAGGELFFAGVFDGAIPETQYHDEPTIAVGRIVKEDDGCIQMEKAIMISPKQMRDAHRATNYSPMDCLRGLWFEASTIAPNLLGKVEVKSQDVRQRMALAVQ